MSDRTGDWILVRGSTPEAIRAAIEEHAGLTAHEVPSCHRVAVFRMDDGNYAIRFNPSLPPYAFTNLINWLDDPNMTKGAAGAVGWFTSSATGKRYYLLPTGGDTLAGLGDDGTAVEVFLPNGSLRRSRKKVEPWPEPAVAFGQLAPVIEFEVEVDSDRSFGNPDFVEG